VIVFPLRVITGGVMSFTVIVKLHVDELPAASVAVACTVVVPTGKLEPDTWSIMTEGTEQLSLAPALNVTGAAQVPETALTVMLLGQLMLGGVLSITVIVCVAQAELVAASVAVYLRLIISGLAGEPAPPLFVSITPTVGVPQLSDAVASEALAGGT
jgi:hypothetical protein